jgi:hypothetical protein
MVVVCSGEIFEASACQPCAIADGSKTHCLGGSVLVFSVALISSVVFLRFFQSLHMIFANIMHLFLGFVSLDQPSLFSSGALV